MLSSRRDRHDLVAASLAARSDEELAALLRDAPAGGVGAGGATSVLSVDGIPVLAKRVAITDRELAHPHSTANLFDLPTSCQYGMHRLDGRRLTVLDDRGWTESGPPDIWRHTSVESITAQARTVVGPDEPSEGHSEEASDADHLEYLTGLLDQQDVHIAAGELQRLPHDVEPTERLRIRLSND